MRLKQKSTITTKEEKKKSVKNGKRNARAEAQKKAGQTPPHKCRVKQDQSTGIEVTAEGEVSAGQIDPSSPEADAAVMQALLHMATSGKYITATIFWAKVRCGMNEKGRGKEQGAGQAPTIVIRTEEGKKA